jgi:hypothetical protein
LRKGRFTVLRSKKVEKSLFGSNLKITNCKYFRVRD